MTDGASSAGSRGGFLPPAQLRALSGMELLEGLRDGRYAPPPIAVLLGYTLAEVRKGEAVFTCVPRFEHYNPIGSVHGGLAGVLLDSAMSCAAQTHLAAGQGYTTLEYRVHLVRGMTEATGLVRAEGTSVHVGRRTATAEGRIVDAAGKLYAHGTTTCLIFDM